MVAIAVVIYLFAQPPWNAMRIIGLCLMVPSFVLLTLARVQLGNAFSITAQAKGLVTQGLYSRIRNPIYVFSALGIAGLFLYLNRPVLLFLLLLLVPLQVFRARREGRVLEARFGEEYRRYKAGTWF